MFPQRDTQYGASRAMSMEYDEGLRAYMLKVFTLMAFGLGFTGALSYYVSGQEAIMRALLTAPMSYIVMLAPLGVVIYMSVRIHKLSVGTAKALFWGYAALIAVSTAPIFLMYTGASIARIFFVTAGAFGALALYGYTTKKDLSGLGTFLIMGVFGLIILGLVNMFLQSPGLHFALSAVGVLVFAGLTAYDMQNIKRGFYIHGGTGEVAEKAAVFGALQLYIDFIAMFLNLLSLFGQER